MKVSLTGRDAELVAAAVNQGIDSRLEGVTKSELRWGRRPVVGILDLRGDIHPDDLRVICRRLLETGDEDAETLARDLWTAEHGEDAEDGLYDLTKG